MYSSIMVVSECIAQLWLPLNVCLFAIMYGNSVCALMNKSNTTSNNIGNEKRKCNIILEMLDCLYDLSDCAKPFVLVVFS